MNDAIKPRTVLFFTTMLAVLAAPAPAEQEDLPHPATQPQTDQQVIGDPPQLPRNFPDDVPLYPAMQSPTVARAGDAYTVRGQIPDSGVKVADNLTESMAEHGWTRVTDDRNPAAHYMTFSKNGRKVDVTLTLEDQITLLRMRVPEQTTAP